jgi:hypothetical protein
MWKSLTFLFCIATCSGAGAIEVFIIAGQSNAEGGAFIGDATPANQAAFGPDYAPITYSFHYENDPNPDVVGAFGNLRTNSGYHGWEISAGRTLDAALPGKEIAIMKYTAGGTDLANDWNPTLTNLYDDFISYINLQVAELQLTHTEVSLTGLLWHQGEGDADEIPALAYGSNLVNFFDAVRIDLNAPELNFVAGKLNQTGSWALSNDWEDDINAGIQSAADTHAYIATITTTDDIQLQPDSLHYHSNGHIELGQRMADSFIQNFIIPEPSTLTLILLGSATLFRRRRTPPSPA